MDLSVVVPTLNARDRLAASLDSLAEHAPGTEVIVVNGPSADGTTGMVRSREDVDVLVEISDRNPNVARNAGIEAASGDAVAFLAHDLAIDAGWARGIRTALADAPAATGPLQRAPRPGSPTDGADRRELFGREVTYFHGGNVAFTRPVLEEMDGFDEYLRTGGATDAAHRLAGLGYRIQWASAVAVRPGFDGNSSRPAAGAGAGGAGDLLPTDVGIVEGRSDGDTADADADVDAGTGEGNGDLDTTLGWKWTYRALAYTLVKNYGPRPGVLRWVGGRAVRDGAAAGRRALRGRTTPTAWIGSGREVIGGIATGVSDGVVARIRDRSSARNPHGLSTRADRAVAQYDRRTDGDAG